MLSNNETPLEERTDLSTQERRLWRSLIRVTDLNPENGKVSFVFPSWNPCEPIPYDLDQLPVELRENLHVGYRFFATVNIGAGSQRDIYVDISAWEE